MCPFLSRCNNVMNQDSSIIDLGCTTSRSWAEINDQVRVEFIFKLTRSDKNNLNSCLGLVIALLNPI